MMIRPEREEDYFEVENMVRDSFWNIYRPGAFEHFIVHRLRHDERFISAYIIEDNCGIIGYISYSKGTIRFEDKSSDAVVLGPVAVKEECQNQGIGTKLIKYTLDLAKKYPYIFVIGDENYYSRFGFKSASQYSIYLDGTDFSLENPFFMIKVNDESKITNELGVFSNPDAFDVDEDEVDEFDGQFEYREKLILEGQLGV